MKEKRYFCDWALSPFSEKKGRQVSKVLLISFIVITAISILITMHNHGEDLEVYSENAYKYLDEIADRVIGKNGINVAAIPEDVVKYEITYKNGEIIFEYSLDNNKGKLYAPSASMTVTLSKDFEILSKEPNFSSREEYVKVFYTFVLLLGALNWCVVGMASCFVMLVLASISIIHKKMSMKK